ncbi:MAG: aldehyde dehydrogenase, partial [Maritimibacter sp.]|nr:aldehyde dehydrogenase [Maritimibacter sp.]
MNIKDIFETMGWGTAPESPDVALDWIAARGGIAGNFTGGKWGPLRADIDILNPATGERLAGLTRSTADEVNAAVAAARKA